MSGLHVHSICNAHTDGRMVVAFGDAGRHLELEISPADHPDLEAAYVNLMELLVVAAQRVMLDMVTPDVPDNLDGLPKAPPCRICDRSDPSNVVRHGRPYCADHDPERTAAG